MKVCVWKTGHAIADIVADAMMDGIPDASLATVYDNIWPNAQVHMAYGILRGIAAIFNECDDALGEPWLNVDRGYFRPNHYDGYYRVSLRGTQQTTGLNKLTPDYERLERLNLDIKPWRGFDNSKPVLVCPPTEHVVKFFKVHDWLEQAAMDLGRNIIVRGKGSIDSINFHDYSHVVTFNSSVGWQALMAGIPCISDPEHSIVGAWFKDYNSPESLSEAQHNTRERLFATMASLQLTLDEMRAGKIWELIQTLLSTSDTTAANLYAPTLQPIASLAEPKPKLEYII